MATIQFKCGDTPAMSYYSTTYSFPGKIRSYVYPQKDTNYVNYVYADFDHYSGLCGGANTTGTEPGTTYGTFEGITRLQYLKIKNTENITDFNYFVGISSGVISIDTTELSLESATNVYGMFLSKSKLAELDMSNISCENVESFGRMFKDCTAIKELNLSKFKTTKSTNMKEMFSGCSSLETLDISGFTEEELANVTDMFLNCTSLQTVYLNQAIRGGLIETQLLKDCPNVNIIYGSPSTGTNNIKLGDKTISKVYLGDNEIHKVYAGDKLVHEA